MSIVNMWGFEAQNLIEDGVVALSNVWSYETSILPPQGNSVAALKNSSTNGGNLVFHLDNSITEFYVHFKMRVGTLTTHRLGFWDNSVEKQAVYWTGGSVRIYSNVSTIRDTSAVLVSLNQWHTYIVHVKLHATTGFIHVYLDGDLSTPIATWTGDTSTTSGGMDYMKLYLLHNGVAYFDDCLWMNPNDATGVVDPEKLVNCSIGVSAPNADGNYTAMTATPGAGSDYQDINEVPPDSSSYIAATAINTRSTFGYENVSTGEVLAVKWKGSFRRNDTVAGANFNLALRQSAADYDNGLHTVPGIGRKHVMLNLAPDSTAWSTTKFNSIEFGVESET